MQSYFSLTRIWGVVVKEFKEMRHDPVTALMILLIPLMQIFLFAYTINNDPKHIPTVIVAADDSKFVRDVINQLQLSEYFDIIQGKHSQAEADELLRTNKAQFAFYFPPDFTRDLVRNKRPQLLVEADATDPASVSYAFAALSQLNEQFFANYSGSLQYLRTAPAPIDIVVHPKYNPERISEYNIVPALLGVILTVTLVLVTSLAVVRERETGTMEVLLTTPLKPTEIIIGKMLPYVIIAYVQALFIIFLSYYLFKVPIYGSVLLLLFSCLPFILANLVLGIAFSAYATSQIQATQLVLFYFLPAILFSGFMFPFHGLPDWGQVIGNLLPATHFLIIVRGIMLKGNGLQQIYPNLLALMVFFFVFLVLSVSRFRKTLD